MAKTILEDAMEDAKLLKETAVENAKNVLVEALSGKIKQFVEGQLGECPMPMEMGQPMTAPVPNMAVETGMYEMEDENDAQSHCLCDDEKDGEEKEGEDKDGEEDVEEEALSLAGVAEAKNEEDEEDKMDESKEEVVEITNEDVARAVKQILKGVKLSEADVTKGFGDAEDVNAGGTGLADDKNGESHWSEEEPPAAQDFTVKEAKYKAAIKHLQSENAQYKEACAFLKKNLQEVNLFNSKLLYTSKMLQNSNLSERQRVSIIEMFDTAKDLQQVEFIYKSLSESLKIAGVVSETKKKVGSPLARSSRMTTPSSTLMKENLEKESGENDYSQRMKQLAGLVQ